MSNLLNKLNVLVRASVNSVLSDVSGQESPRAGKIPAERLGKNIDQEITALRKRIDDALTEEETMQNRLDGFQQQIDSCDQQADTALARGDEGEARRLVQQMQRQQQLATMLQTDLEQHRVSTSDFIQRVNTLEAMVSDARRAAPPEQANQAEASNQPVADTSSERTPGVILSNLLREARERVEQAISPDGPGVPGAAGTPVSPDMTGTPGQPAANEPVQHIPVTIESSPVEKPQDQKDARENTETKTVKVNTPNDVDDDLAKRRARLSKPD